MGDGAEVARELQAIQARLAAMATEAERIDIGCDLARIRGDLHRLARDHEGLRHAIASALGLAERSVAAQALAHLDTEDAPEGAMTVAQQTTEESPHDPPS